MSGLAEALATLGHETHLVFVGDPTEPGEERLLDGNLVIHRWCQWLSRAFPGGAYDGEDHKRVDLTQSVPPFIVEQIAQPAIRAGKRLVVISEEWQTAEAAIELSDQLHLAGLRENAELLWNANHTYGLDRVDWQRLRYTNRITTVSRFMRSELQRFGIKAEVVPNGIPRRLLKRIGSSETARVRTKVRKDLLFFKMARWAMDKGWPESLEAVAQLRAAGYHVALLARGSGDPHVGQEVTRIAEGLGLRVTHAASQHEMLDAASESDVVFIRAFIDEATARSLYAAADGARELELRAVRTGWTRNDGRRRSRVHRRDRRGLRRAWLQRRGARYGQPARDRRGGRATATLPGRTTSAAPSRPAHRGGIHVGQRGRTTHAQRAVRGRTLDRLQLGVKQASQTLEAIG